MISLHGYWRSTASYRVRIALSLKGIQYENLTHDLRSGAHRNIDYLALNPLGLVPAVEADGQTVRQSLALREWLEERNPAPPLLPSSSNGRAIVRAICGIICANIHPSTTCASCKPCEASSRQIRRLSIAGSAMGCRLFPRVKLPIVSQGVV